MFELINIAYATTSRCSGELWNAEATTTCQLVMDSFPLFYIVGGTLLALLVLYSIYIAFKKFGFAILR